MKNTQTIIIDTHLRLTSKVMSKKTGKPVIGTVVGHELASFYIIKTRTVLAHGMSCILIGDIK